MPETEITIIGAGVIGLAVAYALGKSAKSIILLEKNDSFGQETSSRNSEVIHSGLYYQPGSLKAETCIHGQKLLYEFCAKNNIGYKKLGKLVIAAQKEEVEKIEQIYQNALACGVKDLQFLDKSAIGKLEPEICALAGFFSPRTGIIDSHALMKVLYHEAKASGIIFSFATEVTAIEKKDSAYEIRVREHSGNSFSFSSRAVVNAAGLYSDQISSMVAIVEPNYKIHYCKGQYFRLKNPEKFKLKHLVYPPATLIDLGIHITPDLNQGLRLGPDAQYVFQIDYTINEADKIKFYASVKKFLPALKPEDLIPDTAGIRPKLQKENENFRDFVIKEESDRGLAGFINLIGIESPGLTSCLAIAEMVATILKVKEDIF